jgi:hypothetical protein
MNQELESLERTERLATMGQGLVGIKWTNDEAAAPISVEVIEKPAAVSPERQTKRCRRARRRLLHNFLQPTFGGIVMFFGLIGLFGLYWLSCLGKAVGFDRNRRFRWKNTGRLLCISGLALLFAAGLMGCVGYVGPDYGPGYVGPVYDGPDVYVFGGGYYHGNYAHAYSHRGAVSRGFGGGHAGGHGGGGHR